MSKISNIYLWRCDLTSHDYLFFATTKRGQIVEAGQFIHNYSLTYALGWAKSEWHIEIQEPQYAQQLSEIRGIYVTPASLLTGRYTLMAYRTEMESYTLSTISNLDNTSHGIIKCFRPGSVFRFYILARLHLNEIPPLVRLGRFMAKTAVTKQHPIELEVTEGSCTASLILNWDDMAVKPSLCDVILCALPGRLIENARFVGIRYLRARFADGAEVEIPLDMGYLRKDLCSSWCENAA